MDQNMNPAPSFEAQELPPMSEPPKKNNKTWLIILIVVIVLCCCCSVVAGGWYLYSNGDEIFNMMGAVLPLLV